MADAGDDDDAKQLQEFETVMETRSDMYASGPLCWGPLQWMAMHQMARGYPHRPSPEKQAAIKAYMVALVDLLPCSICSTHWKAIAPTVKTESRHAFLKWTIDVHNKVNKRTGKPVLDYSAALDTIHASCQDNCLSSISTLRKETSGHKQHHHQHDGASGRHPQKTLLYVFSAIIVLLLLLVLLLTILQCKSHVKITGKTKPIHTTSVISSPAGER